MRSFLNPSSGKIFRVVARNTIDRGRMKIRQNTMIGVTDLSPLPGRFTNISKREMLLDEGHPGSIEYKTGIQYSETAMKRI